MLAWPVVRLVGWSANLRSLACGSQISAGDKQIFALQADCCRRSSALTEAPIDERRPNKESLLKELSAREGRRPINFNGRRRCSRRRRRRRCSRTLAAAAANKRRPAASLQEKEEGKTATVRDTGSGGASCALRCYQTNVAAKQTVASQTVAPLALQSARLATMANIVFAPKPPLPSRPAGSLVARARAGNGSQLINARAEVRAIKLHNRAATCCRRRRRQLIFLFLFFLSEMRSQLASSASASLTLPSLLSNSPPPRAHIWSPRASGCAQFAIAPAA